MNKALQFAKQGSVPGGKTKAESQDLLELIEGSGAVFVSAGSHGEIEYLSPLFLQLEGKSAAHLQGLTIMDLFPQRKKTQPEFFLNSGKVRI